ncbi:MAG TPA: hypothetical protein VFH53_08610 [Phycisphaerae bacterium]|nr:hypothetical protein [Phycisphaerae bacterium]
MAKERKALEKENARLKNLVANQALDIQILKEAARDVMPTLEYLFAVRGAPEPVRSDNGPEFIAQEIQRWLSSASGGTLYIQKAGPWEHGYVESFNGRVG